MRARRQATARLKDFSRDNYRGRGRYYEGRVDVSRSRSSSVRAPLIPYTRDTRILLRLSASHFTPTCRKIEAAISTGGYKGRHCYRFTESWANGALMGFAGIMARIPDSFAASLWDVRRRSPGGVRPTVSGAPDLRQPPTFPVECCVGRTRSALLAWQPCSA